MDVIAGANYLKEVGSWCGVEIKNGQRSAAGLVSAERHGGDVDAVIAEQRADPTDHAGAIGVFENKKNAVRTRFDWPAVDADDAGGCAEECAADRKSFAFGDGGELKQIGVIARRAYPRLVYF